MMAERGASSKPVSSRSAEKPSLSRHCTKAPGHSLQRYSSCHQAGHTGRQQGLSFGQQQKRDDTPSETTAPNALHLEAIATST